MLNSSQPQKGSIFNFIVLNTSDKRNAEENKPWSQYWGVFSWERWC